MVVQQSRSIGLRMALGATTSRIARSVLADASRLIAARTSPRAQLVAAVARGHARVSFNRAKRPDFGAECHPLSPHEIARLACTLTIHPGRNLLTGIASCRSSIPSSSREAMRGLSEHKVGNESRAVS